MLLRSCGLAALPVQGADAQVDGFDKLAGGNVLVTIAEQVYVGRPTRHWLQHLPCFPPAPVFLCCPCPWAREVAASHEVARGVVLFVTGAGTALRGFCALCAPKQRGGRRLHLAKRPPPGGRLAC